MRIIDSQSFSVEIHSKIFYIHVIGDNPDKIRNLLKIHISEKYSLKKISEKEFTKKTLDKIASDIDEGVSD